MDTETKSYSFAEALIPPTHVICGIQLYPFTLGSWVVLENYNSPLLSPDLYPEEVYDDTTENYKYCIRHVLLFLMCCAHKYEDNIRLMEEPAFFEQTRDEFQVHFSSYISKVKHWNIYAEIGEIRKYLDYYINSMPVFSEKSTSSPPSGVDWKSNIYSVLKNEYGYTQSEIMNMSMRRIFDEWVTFASKNGCIIVKTKQQLEMEKNAAEYMEKVRKGEVKLEGINT